VYYCEKRGSNRFEDCPQFHCVSYVHLCLCVKGEEKGGVGSFRERGRERERKRERETERGRKKGREREGERERERERETDREKEKFASLYHNS